jgi:hypothetical protein
MPKELTEHEQELLKQWPKRPTKVSEEMSIKPILEKMMTKMKADIAAQKNKATRASNQADQ